MTFRAPKFWKPTPPGEIEHPEKKLRKGEYNSQEGLGGRPPMFVFSIGKLEKRLEPKTVAGNRVQKTRGSRKEEELDPAQVGKFNLCWELTRKKN